METVWRQEQEHGNQTAVAVMVSYRFWIEMRVTSLEISLSSLIFVYSQYTNYWYMNS